MHIVRDELSKPLQRARLGIKHDHRRSIQVLSHSRVAEEIGDRIAYGDVEKSVRGVERRRYPDGAAAVRFAFGAAPGFGAWFSFVGDGVELPDRLAIR